MVGLPTLIPPNYDNNNTDLLLVYTGRIIGCIQMQNIYKFVISYLHTVIYELTVPYRHIYTTENMSNAG